VSRRIDRLILFVLFAVAGASAVADDGPIHKPVPGAPDLPGCKDSTILRRMASCTITSCDRKDNAPAALPVSAADPKTGARKKKAVTGEREITRYICSAQLPAPYIAHQVETALRSLAYTLDHSDETGDARVVTGHKDGLWVSVLAEPAPPYSTYTLTTVRAAAKAPAASR
jgi:hypothetical protein